jgi:hypothetical protein
LRSIKSEQNEKRHQDAVGVFEKQAGISPGRKSSGKWLQRKGSTRSDPKNSWFYRGFKHNPL